MTNNFLCHIRKTNDELTSGTPVH